MEEHQLKAISERQNTRATKQTSRRLFLQGTAIAVGSATVIGSFLRVAANPLRPESRQKGSEAIRPTQLHTRLIQWSETSLPDGRECEGTFEIKDENGTFANAHYFGKWISHDNQEYMIVQRLAPTNLTRGFSCIVSGTKGRIQGDYRTDRVAVTFMDDNGVIQRNPETEVNVLLVNPYQGMTPVDAAAAFRRDRNARNLK